MVDNSKKYLFFLTLILITYLIFGVYLRYETLDIIRFNDWLTRDFDRAFNLIEGNYIPLAGPETTGGGRLPGPFLYFLLAFPLLFHESYEAIFVFNFIFNSASLFLFFFIIKRYFGFYPSLISTILFSINLLHVDAVAFAINPVFLFPFIIIFIGCLLEFAAHKNPKYFPLMYLILFLMTQIHYSVITFSLVPVVIALIFKIRIPIKQILITLLVFVICFSPYFLYKYQTFVLNVPGNNKTFSFEIPDFFNLTFIKSILIQETLNRLSWKVGAIPFFLENKGIYPQIYYFIISIAFFGLIAFKVFRKNITERKGETTILLLFYIPALLYDISHPTTSHLWYSYIFIPTSLIVIGLFINNVFEIVSAKKYKIPIAFGLIGLILYLTIFSFKAFQYQKAFTKMKVDLGFQGSVHNQNYAHFKFLIDLVYKELRLNSKEYIEQVYFEGFSPYSQKLLQLIAKDTDSIDFKKGFKNKNKCFYIIDMKYLKPNTDGSKVENQPAYTASIAKVQFDAFLKDPTININFQHVRNINLFKHGFRNVLNIYEYTPKQEQSCYSNSSNFFLTEKKLRDLMIKSNKIRAVNNSYSPYIIEKAEKYESNLELNSFSRDFIVYDSQIKTPFRIKFDLHKKNGNYILKFEINLYSFLSRLDAFNFHNLGVSIRQNGDGNTKIKNTNYFEIISQNSWISKKAVNRMHTNKLIWKSKINLPKDINLKKNQFKIHLLWSNKFPDRPKKQKCCYEKSTQL